jgi:hypothetical protein
MLRRFPSFLSFDLESHIRPRAEFLRAMKIDPLINGLSFLVNAPPKEIAYTAGVKLISECLHRNVEKEVYSRKVTTKEYSKK